MTIGETKMINEVTVLLTEKPSIEVLRITTSKNTYNECMLFKYDYLYIDRYHDFSYVSI